MQLRRYRFPLSVLLGLLTLVLVACPNENPAILATNQTNTTGGTLQITGSGFTAGNPIKVAILNVPGSTAPWSQAAGSADGSGKINVTISYSLNMSSNPPLPGCANINQPGYLTTLNVTAADSTTNAFGAAQVQVANCAWTTPQVSSHQ